MKIRHRTLWSPSSATFQGANLSRNKARTKARMSSVHRSLQAKLDLVCSLFVSSLKLLSSQTIEAIFLWGTGGICCLSHTTSMDSAKSLRQHASLALCEVSRAQLRIIQVHEPKNFNQEKHEQCLAWSFVMNVRGCGENFRSCWS